jgi:hypothetical protein
MSTKKGKKLRPLKNLQKEADKWMSLYIRHRYANWKGEVTCYTCGSRKPIKDMQNGHFISRAKIPTRYDEDNCRPQCVGCNIYRHGNYTEYSRKLVVQLGPTILDRLKKRSNKKLKTTTRQFYEDNITKYKKLYEHHRKM